MTKQAGGDDTEQADGGWSNLGFLGKMTILGIASTILFGLATLALDVTERFDDDPAPTPLVIVPEPEPTATLMPTVTPTPAPAIEIVRIEYAPTDQDREYVELRNSGSEELSMLGWRLEDSDNHSFDKFEDFALMPGASVKIWTCEGDNGPSDLYWQRKAPVWNNDRPDTATLRDDLGVIIATRTYDP